MLEVLLAHRKAADLAATVVIALGPVLVVGLVAWICARVERPNWRTRT